MGDVTGFSARDIKKKLKHEAQADWRELCENTCETSDTAEVERQVKGWADQYLPLTPEAFQSRKVNGEPNSAEFRHRQARGVELVYGKADQRGVRHGNHGGRLRVHEGELQHRVLPIKEIKELAKFADVVSSQFDPIFRAEIDAALAELMPEHSVYNLEFKEGLHSHFACKRESTDLGRFIRNVLDSNLVTLIGYMGKRPEFDLDTASSLLIVRQALSHGLLPGNRLQGRFMAKGVSFAETGITFDDICQVLGHPDNPARMGDGINPVRKESHDRIYLPIQTTVKSGELVAIPDEQMFPNPARMGVEPDSARMGMPDAEELVYQELERMFPGYISRPPKPFAAGRH